jgi:hypothetical protein
VFMVRSESGVTRMKERAVAGPSVEGRRFEMHTLRAHVVAVDVAQLVLLDLAEIGRLATEGGDPRRGVARRAAGDFLAGPITA